VSVDFLPNTASETQRALAKAHMERRARLYNAPAPAVVAVAQPPRKLVVVAPVSPPPPVVAPVGVVSAPPPAAPVAPDAGNWTGDEVTQLDVLWNVEGKTASECAKVLGKTRNAVIGKVHRLKFSKRMTKKQKSVGWSAAAREAARDRRAAVMKAKRAADDLPRMVFRNNGTAVKVAPPIGASDKDLVAQWLARNGGPRKFESGATGDPGMIALWLRSRGFQTSYKQGAGGGVVKVIYPDGRRAALTLKKLTDLADSIRVLEGLTPLGQQNATLVKEGLMQAA